MFDYDRLPLPAVTLLLVTMVGTLAALAVESVVLRNIVRREILRYRAPRMGPTRVTLLGSEGDLPPAVAMLAMRTAPGFVTGERQIDEATAHELWLRRMLRGEIIRRGGGRRELDRLRRVALVFEIRASGVAFDFRWQGRTLDDDQGCAFTEGDPFVNWLAAATAARGYPTSVAELDAVLDHVLTPDAETSSVSDSHPPPIRNGLDDPAVDRAVVPTGPPAAPRTTPFRVLPAAA